MSSTILLNQDVQIHVRGANLEGNITIPPGAEGIVVFVHGSGSSRFSPRNQFVANVLNGGGLATLLFDLLTPQEEQIDLRTRHLQFDIDLLAQRTISVTDWLTHHVEAGDLNFGYFGSSTGAAAALIAAAERPELAKAVVSRGGRPDLAARALGKVTAPVLFLVGGLDDVVIDLNRQVLAQIGSKTEKRLEIIPGATHLFEEPGTLELAARQARDWFKKYLSFANFSGGL